MMDGEYESATALVIMLTQNHETEVEEDFEDIYQQTKNKSSRKVASIFQ